MIADLKKDGLLNAIRARTKALERDVARELWRLTDPRQIGSNNPAAVKIAGIIGKTQEMARQMVNAEGAYVRKLPGWVVRQSHDAFSIAHASATTMMERYTTRGGTDADFKAWSEFVSPLLDERTFDGVAPEDRGKWLRNVYNNLVNGVHTKAANRGDWLGGYKGPGNLGKKASQERVIHFKDADSWFNYNERFGSGALFESVVGGLLGSARDIALMRTWGTNPEAMFNKTRTQLIDAANNRGDGAEVDRLRSSRVQWEFDALTGGKNNVPGNPTLAAWGNGLRAIQSMAKLGGVVLSSLPDIVVRASALRHHGIGFLEGMANGLASVFQGRGTGWTREFNDYMGIGIDGSLGHMHAQFNATDGFAGRASKLMDLFFRANLLNWWTDSMKTGVGSILARNLARNADLGWGAINEDLRRSLGRFGIDEATWDHIRTKGLQEGEGGVKFVTAEGLDAEASNLLRMYFVDTVNESMTIGGARERAMTTFGTTAGTPLGEAVRMVMQFKSFPITYLSRSVRRELSRKGAVDYGGLAALMVGTTAMGYLSMTAKELAKGRNMRDPLDPATWGAAFTQGGGAGIYGDFLLGDYNRFGGGLWETALGPTAGTLSDIGKIKSDVADKILKMYRGETGGPNLGADLTRFATNHAPFINMFYTRIALDYLLLWHINEAMSPGWAKRFEDTTARDNKQTFWLSPRKTVQQWPPSTAAISAPGIARPGGGGVTIEGGP
jgi:hypothetical protein